MSSKEAVDALRRGVRDHLDGGESRYWRSFWLAFGGVLDRHRDHGFGLGTAPPAVIAGFRAAHVSLVHLDDSIQLIALVPVLHGLANLVLHQPRRLVGVRVMLIIGPTGTGKSVHGNNLVALEQKYGGFTYIFDIGGSYESVVELYGGRVDRVGKDGPRVNPFALEPTESNIKFLYSFVKLLLTNGGAELEPEDDDVIHKAVQDMYLLDAANRRLSNLFLPKKLDRYLTIGKKRLDFHRSEEKN